MWHAGWRDPSNFEESKRLPVRSVRVRFCHIHCWYMTLKSWPRMNESLEPKKDVSHLCPKINLRHKGFLKGMATHMAAISTQL